MLREFFTDAAALVSLGLLLAGIYVACAILSPIAVF